MRVAGTPAIAVVMASLLSVAVAVAACSPAEPTSMPGSQPPDAPASGSPVLSSGGPSVPATTPGSTGTAAGGVELDPSLLGILPPEVDGIPVTAEPEAFDEALADPGFVTSVGAAAFPVAAAGDDLASGVVARLRPDTWSEAFFRDWRDSYDEGACGQAGGVVGNAEAELGGRPVHITSCAGGLLVYHAYLPERDVIVSLFSLGERRLGERLMGDLRP